jgi:hypothetical protein
MGWLSVIIGALLIGWGGYVLARRKEYPEQPKQVFGLDPLQDVLGDGVGSAVHWGVFVVAPFVLGGYAFFVGLGFDRRWAPEPAPEPAPELSGRAEPTPEEHAAFQLVMTQARLIGAGFMVSMLEHPEGLRVSGDHFAGAILKSEAGWRVVCDDHSFQVASLIEAEAKILACHHPR